MHFPSEIGFTYIISAALPGGEAFIFGCLPSLSALVVFSLSTDAKALLPGSFCSPALIASTVSGLQSGGISLKGGGSVAIWNHPHHKRDPIKA